MGSQSFDEPGDKAAFFGWLDGVDIPDADSGGEGDKFDKKEQQHREKARAFFPPRKKLKPLLPAPRRILSAPTPSALRVIKATPAAQNAKATRHHMDDQPAAATDVSIINETPVPDTARPGHPSLQRRSTFPLAAPTPVIEESPSMASSMKKRKRRATTNLIPESEQVLRGLSLYYIPNNDIAPARRLRITRAQEYGAKRASNVLEASHIVVDKNLCFKDIQTFLGSVLEPSLVIVNEDYPIDCVKFRTVLDHDQKRYQVPGCPLPEQPPTPLPADIIPSSQASDRSLPLKEPQQNPRKWDHAPRKGTPPRSEESTPYSKTQKAVQVGLQGQSSVEETDNNFSNDVSAATKGGPSSASKPPVQEATTRESGAGVLANTSSNNVSAAPKDDLSEYIELMRQYKDIPLDTEEDDIQSVADAQEVVDSDVEEGSEDERLRKRRSTRSTRSGQKAITFEDRFACNNGGTKDRPEDAQNPNARTIEVLQAMCDYYTRINDHWRTTAYRKAISTLRRQTTKVTTENQAYSLPNIGRRLAMKIEEIVNTDRLKRLEYANNEPLDKVLELFLRIYDVGISRANKWISQGFRTLEDLKEKAPLTTNQRIGVDHFDDLNTRIPRSEVTALGDYVKREAAKLDPNVELLIGGSYRRGADSSGDIDFIITKRNTSSVSELVPFLQELVDVLTKKGFLVATLSALHADRQGKDGPGSKWHGCCVLPQGHPPTPNSTSPPPKPIWRRIDLLLVPETEYGAALIYFTGNDIFNRSMRLLASKKGMRLNQRGLYKDVMRGRARIKVTEGELVEGRDEKRIFEILGVKWREPCERWC